MSALTNTIKAASLLTALAAAPECRAGTLTILHTTKDYTVEGDDAAGLIALNGNLYIANQSGGASNAGTLLQLNIATGNVEVTHTFTGKQDGRLPLGLVVAKDRVYGVTRFAGSGPKGRGGGTLYKIFPELGVISKQQRFPPNSQPRPVKAPAYAAGALYGVLSAPSIQIYRYDLSTKTQTLLPVLNSKDYTPNGGLIRSGAFLYGFASGDRTTGYAQILYRLDPATQQQTPIAFANPFNLMTSNGGNLLYGMTESNLSNQRSEVIALDIRSGAETILYKLPTGHKMEARLRTLVWAQAASTAHTKANTGQALPCSKSI